MTKSVTPSTTNSHRQQQVNVTQMQTIVNEPITTNDCINMLANQTSISNEQLRSIALTLARRVGAIENRPVTLVSNQQVQVSADQQQVTTYFSHEEPTEVLGRKENSRWYL